MSGSRGRAGIGALMLASWVDGEWVYVGRLGTDFNDQLLRLLAKQLPPREARNAALTASATRHKEFW